MKASQFFFCLGLNSFKICSCEISAKLINILLTKEFYESFSTRFCGRFTSDMLFLYKVCWGANHLG